MNQKTIAVGVAVSDRGESTFTHTLRSIDAAGFAQPWIFADGEVEIPEGFQTSRRRPKIGGWPNFLLGLTELVLRNPTADGVLMVQDDVMFSRRVKSYLDTNRMEYAHGIFSFFCPIIYNRSDIGWHEVKSGWGFCGAQALYFPMRRAVEFLSSPTAQSYRVHPPEHSTARSPRDGLTGIDSVVGKWAEQTKCKIFVHTPSLCQHIGVSSAMWKDFHSNLRNRYADDFPGRSVDCSRVYPNYMRWTKALCDNGLRKNHSMHAGLWAVISQHIKKGTKTIEFCPGLSTLLFSHDQCDHICLSFSNASSDRLSNAFGNVANQICDVIGIDDCWLMKHGLQYEIVYINYLQVAQHAAKVREFVKKLAVKSALVFIDGIDRPEGQAFAYSLAEDCGWDVSISSAGQSGYGILTSEEQLERPPLWLS